MVTPIDTFNRSDHLSWLVCNDLARLTYSLHVIYECELSELSLWLSDMWLSDMWLCTNHTCVLDFDNHVLISPSHIVV